MIQDDDFGLTDAACVAAIRAALKTPLPGVRGDIFHLIYGIGGTIKKDQPMRRRFLSLLSDALLPTLADDVAAAEQRLREHGLTDAQIANLREHHWRDQLTKGCRRFSGNDPEAQLRRVITVVLEFAHHVNPANDEPLLRPVTMAKIHSAYELIARGFFLDPFGENTYMSLGKDADGIERFATIRGTNALEGYHQKINAILGQHASSPQYAYLLIMEFVTRWNIKRARKLRGRMDHLSAFFDQGMMEDIELDLSLLGMPSLFNIPCSYNFAPNLHPITGEEETFGVVQHPGAGDSVTREKQLQALQLDLRQVDEESGEVESGDPRTDSLFADGDDALQATTKALRWLATAPSPSAVRAIRC